MKEYLEFKKARCKDCYKCVRECPVKAIEVKEHQARIIKERCILCGRCTVVCPQNAKIVHSEKESVESLLLGNTPVVASVAPSFISSFRLHDFSQMSEVLQRLGFALSEETAVGANAVTKEYLKHMMTGNYENFITSACPALCRLIQEYYPEALKFLAPVDSPMIAHAKMLRKRYPGHKIVFIGPCIAKKREAKESGLVDGVLTFEDLRSLMVERGLVFPLPEPIRKADDGMPANRSKAYPIHRGIIQSIEKRPKGYEYVAVDGPQNCVDTLKHIDKISGAFLEMNMCVNACVSGPCSMVESGEDVRATMDVKKYVRADKNARRREEPGDRPYDVDLAASYPRIEGKGLIPTEEQITEILRRTGKFKPEDELNCGSCGFHTCREKAWAVFNGYADIDICLPYMRERAESMSYEIVHNSPDGVIILDRDLKVVDINQKAKELLGIEAFSLKGLPASDFFDTSEFLIAYSSGRDKVWRKIFLNSTKKYVQLSISILKGREVLFGIMKDITEDVRYNERLEQMTMETLATTDEVIKKQMMVAQEIASLLGETTAETKVALLKLKSTLLKDKDRNKDEE